MHDAAFSLRGFKGSEVRAHRAGAMTDSLKALRDQIDALDQRLVGLLNERARLAQRVGEMKNGGPAYRPERETQVLNRVRELGAGPLPPEAVARIYTEIISACRALEAEMSVAYLGPPGTFSEEAVVKHFGGSVQGLPCNSIDETFHSVESGAAAYGMVPVENSTEGAVGRTNDLLFLKPAAICGEVMLPVHQCLMQRSGRAEGFSKIYSHSQSLAQCRGWLNAHYQHVERVAVVSNAEAARLASLDDDAAAVAGRLAAQRYGLTIVAANIEDEQRNITRFLVIGKQGAEPTGRDRTSLVMATRNRPGAVHELLMPLAKHQVSMSRFESRPARSGLWEYLFFVDVEGHEQDDHVARALAEMREKATFVKVLGSYPIAPD
jgi:chorismate mutase / prephenate dehydratase